MPTNDVGECLTFHLIDDESNAATQHVDAVPSAFTLEVNGHRFHIPAWACRWTKNNRQSAAAKATESLRYYYRIPIEKRLNFSKIDNLMLHVHFYPRVAVARRVQQKVRFQLGALVYDVLRIGPADGLIEPMHWGWFEI